jgi:hypothetical protein
VICLVFFTLPIFVLTSFNVAIQFALNQPVLGS